MFVDVYIERYSFLAVSGSLGFHLYLDFKPRTDGGAASPSSLFK